MEQVTQDLWTGKRLLSILVISGLSISGMSIFMLVDGFSTSTTLTSDYETLCDDGLCYNVATDSIPVGTFVQQSADFDTSTVTQNNEDFSSFSIPKDTVQDYTITGDIATLFASKDSFLREGIKESNEGANEVLRVMGTGPTNNRALIAFDQSQIETVLDGKSLESATLKIFVVSNDGKWLDGQTISIHGLTAGWLEGNGINAPFGSFVGTQKGVNWNCSDGNDCTNWNGGNYDQIPTDTVQITNQVDGIWIEFDVTGDIEAFVDGSENNGWIIMKSDEDAPGRINFAAREAQSNIPQLELTFA
ncbi:MAG: DNRLRE domain-containing protein [Nitrosopumilaceae archaeon]